ncbi:pentapeptide MXKDX repeat protein [Neorhizobium sp. BT27B]|uniref:pentapeptide MXKDX repeat protein n=1 Tax=Neorhizobium sp. BT27B TaxID=3142625 RepID=UPI003D277744
MRTRLFTTTCLAALLGVSLANGIAQAQTSNDAMKKTDTMKSDTMKSGTMSKDGMKADCMHKAGMEKDSMKKSDMMKACDAMN